MIVKYKLALLKNLVSQLVILSTGMLILSSLLKSLFFIYSYCQEYKCFFLSRRNRTLFYNSYLLPRLDLCCIIWGNCSSTLEDILVKFQKRAALVILDCDFHTPFSELFKESQLANIHRKSYISKKAILMYTIINNYVLII